MLKVLFVLKSVEYIDPMGIMLLSSLAKQAGHHTYLHVLSDGEMVDTLERVKPDVVAFSAKTGEHKYYLEANRAVKAFDKSIVTIMGGPHTTFFPGTIDYHDLDAICVGEGDDAWPEFLNALARGGDIHGIPNIQTKLNRAEDRILPLRPKKADLDRLPYLDRDLVYRSTRLRRFPMRSYMAGRGCPYPCTYCFNHAFRAVYRGKGRLYNRFSVERIVAELKVLKAKYETQFIKFYDDIFVFRYDEWLEEFAEKYPREIGLPFHCLVRADLLTEPMLLALKNAGIHSISMSIEAGNDETRNKLLKRNMSKEQITAAFDLCHKHKVPTFCNTILAMPGTGIKEDIESLDLNVRCRVTFGEFPVFHPYPGTELGRYTVEHGYFDGDYDRLHMSYQNESPLTCFSKKEKLMQKNLSLLGTVCLWQPWLRGITVKWLIRLPLTGLYFLAYYLVKVYLIKTKIYPLRLSPTNILKGIYESLSLERFKHSDEKVRSTARRELAPDKTRR